MKTHIFIRLYLSVFLLAFCIVSRSQTTDSLEVNSLVKESYSYIQQRQFEKSRECAEQILKIDSTYCFAYMLIGTAYTSYAKYSKENSTGENEIERSMIYCLAVDMFEKAKNIDSKCTEQAERMIKLYSYYFMHADEVFIDFYEGEEYMIDGWINRKTKVRFAD